MAASSLSESGRRNSFGGCSSCAGNAFGGTGSMTSLTDDPAAFVRVFMAVCCLD